MWVTWLVLACVSGGEDECGAESRALPLDESVREESDEGEIPVFTAGELVEPLASPQLVAALDVQGMVIPVTIAATSDGADATLTGDPSDQGCAASLRVPVTFSLGSDDGTFSVLGSTSVEVDLQAGTYWRRAELTLDADDRVPAALHGDATDRNLSVTWAESVLDQIELWQVTRESRELSLVFDK